MLDIKNAGNCKHDTGWDDARIDGCHPLVNIKGEKIALGPFVREDAPIYERWLNDFDTMRRAGMRIQPWSSGPATGMLDRWLDTTERTWFAVYELATYRPIGFTGLSHIDHLNRTAEFNICIGERGARGKGYGTEAARLVLDYAFTAKGLHSVYLSTSELNLAGQRAYAKAGFKEFGRRRRCDMHGGRLWDLVYMDCLASEFRSPVLKSEFGIEPPG